MKSAIQKLYYSITEVSKIVGEKQHVLRYWEREFPQLKPQKNRAGNRVYTHRDLAVLRLIMRLLRSEQKTVAGAKDYMRQHGPNLEQYFLEDEQAQEENSVDGSGVAQGDESKSQAGSGKGHEGATGAQAVHGKGHEGAAGAQAVDGSLLTEEAKEVVGELRSIAAELRSRASA